MPGALRTGYRASLGLSVVSINHSITRGLKQGARIDSLTR
jgi:hypothetical protein